MWKFILKLSSVSYGKNLKLKGIPVIFNKKNAELTIGDDCIIKSSFLSNLVGLYSRTIIVTRVEGAKIVIGDNVGISGATIYARKEITIGDNTNIGGNVKILDNDFHPIEVEARLKDDKEDRFVEVCNRETNIEMEHYGYAACLYKIRRIEKNIKIVRDAEYISLFEAGYINLHQHRLLNLNTLEGLRLYLDEKLKHVEDLNLYTDEEEMLDFTFDYRVIDLIDATKIAVSLEPNVKFNADRHYVVSKKKTLTVCARSLLGVSEVVRKAKELDAMALDALRYYIELLLLAYN